MTGRLHPLCGLRLDAHRRLGRQHRHPCPRRARLRHPASVRASDRPRPPPAILRPQRRRPVQPEYADVLGIPFDFTAKPVVANRRNPTRDHQRSRSAGAGGLEITLPSRGRLSRRTAERSHFRDLRAGPCVAPHAGIGRAMHRAAGRHRWRRGYVGCEASGYRPSQHHHLQPRQAPAVQAFP